VCEAWLDQEHLRHRLLHASAHRHQARGLAHRLHHRGLAGRKVLGAP
jgi:hypothetical protein